jgi:hypothetical protein
MMETPITTILIAAILILVIGGLLGIVFFHRQRTKRLQERFGPEYEHILNEVGDQGQAESELEARVKHVRNLEIHPLSAEQVERFTEQWKLTQAEFVDTPLGAVQKANRLIKELMIAKGYPVEDFEQRAADISVDYPDMVEDYRGLHALAVKGDDRELTTEELRRAMVHGRALFENLVQQQAQVADTPEKERM